MVASAAVIPAGHVWDRKTKLKAKRLYCVDGLSPKAIAAKTRVPVQTVSNWAWRYGWTRKRAEDEKQALAQAEDQARAEIAATLESVAVRSEELVERGLDLAEEAADSGDAKGFAMAAKGVQSLHGVWRQARGLDASGSAANGRGSSISIIFGQPFSDARAESAVEVSTSPVADAAAEEAVELDFAESQQAAAPAAESAELIGNAAQVVGIGPANTDGLNKARHSQSYVN